MFVDPPRRPAQSNVRSNPWPGASTNGPSLKADDVILVDSKDYKESRNKQTLPYGMFSCKPFQCLLRCK